MELEKEKSYLKYKKISNKILIGVDIGGTLAKFAIVNEKSQLEIENILNSFENMKKIETGNYILHLLFFPTNDFEIEIKPLLNKLNKISPIKEIHATGGGAYKFETLMKKNFQIDFIKNDELISLVEGYIFIKNYSFIYKIEDFDKKIIVPNSDLKYPHISVNIGSGVSILKVNSPFKKDIQRVAGTIMGGGTLIGLSKLLIGIDNYNEILNLAQKGDYHKLDLSYEEIYGKNYIKNNNNYKNEIPVSSFGKIYDLMTVKKNSFEKEDIAVSLLYMICLHITQIANLCAQKYKIDTIYFFGNFTRSSFAISLLNKASLIWNKNLNIRFNILDGFLGVVGTLVEKNED
jgi:type II pantothenate kinase